jgi:small-conductance mechanosensitive channel
MSVERAAVCGRCGHPPRVGAFLVAVLLWLAAVPGWGASGPEARQPPAAAAPATAEGPQVYPLTEVFPRGERSMARLREVREELESDESADLVEADVPRLARQLEEWSTTEVPTLRDGRSVQQVNDLSWELEARLVQLDRWGLLLGDSAKVWVSEAEALGRGMANWQATRAALGADAPSAVRVRIDEVLHENAAVQALYRAKIDGLIAAQSVLAAQREALMQFHKELATVRTRSARGLLARDSPLLWASLFRQPPVQSLAAQASAGWIKFRADVARLAEAIRADLPLHLAAFTGLLWLFVVLRRVSRKPSQVQPTGAEQLVLDRYVCSALLLSLFIVPLLYLDLGLRTVRLVMLPAMIAVLVLRRAIFASGMRAGLNLFAAVFLLDFLRNYMPSQWALTRLLLLAASTLGAAGIAVLLVRLHQRHVRINAVHHWLAVVALVAVLGSAVANVAGNLSLAEYLISPLIRLTFVAIAVRLGVVVTTTVAVLALRTPVALRSRVVQQRGAVAAVKLRRFIGVAGFILWLYLVLFNLGLLASMLQSSVALMKTEWQLGATVISVRDFVIFLLVLLAASVASRALRLILAEEIFPRFPFPRGVPDALVLMARYGVLLFGFLLALSSAGVDLSKVTLALSALGVGIGFGLQNVVNNFVCGLILVFEHPIQVGDYIEVGPHYGRVTRIGFRSSMMLITDGSEVVIPNAELIGNKVVNWSLSDALCRLGIEVPVAHGADTARVIELLKSVADAHPQVRDHPAPRAVLSEISESALKFTLHCWVSTENRSPVRDELRLAVDQAFREAAIPTPLAQAELRLHFPDNPPSGVAAREALAQA